MNKQKLIKQIVSDSILIGLDGSIESGEKQIEKLGDNYVVNITLSYSFSPVYYMASTRINPEEGELEVNYEIESINVGDIEGDEVELTPEQKSEIINSITVEIQ